MIGYCDIMSTPMPASHLLDRGGKGELGGEIKGELGRMVEVRIRELGE